MEIKIIGDAKKVEPILKEIVEWSNIGFEEAFRKKKGVPLVTARYGKNDDGSFTMFMSLDEKAFPLGYGKFWKWHIQKELKKSFKMKGVDVEIEGVKVRPIWEKILRRK